MKHLLLWLKLSLLLIPLGAFAQESAPRVEIQTSMGTIALELNPEKAPKTVDNFLQYVDEGFYDNTLFHRVIDDFMIQGGGFTPTYERKETRPPIVNEADNGLKNKTGTVAMARTADPHSASAQFFINVADNDFLNHSAKTPRGWGYAVFGKVVKGMDVVDKIKSVSTGAAGPFPQDVPDTPVIIEQVTRLNPAQSDSSD
ncbi:peptidylprolyl isomerase [Thiohalophilus thiocyanatoxydans]|uniref:Peptidyl-prolyl cis-trans isomerase n=1 Tax=Thiohalophilus thiocyanatoxydans TaxID=381308 RepID=A0A4R8IHH3_9GAMM|nr:peptidylprolyl isomerase [Thiohalophilus thiocyanatoxydans]TDY00052.1 peptidyl-prolyl cis-trans isomerase B (cyclophilin B) [Thiohalophilus thiocyanatoxydans]